MTDTEAPVKTGPTFILEQDKVTRTLESEGFSQDGEFTLFMESLGRVAPNETGILPPGVMSLRTGGSCTQLVMELPPEVYATCWGLHEGGGHTVYQLAMPWRYVVGVYNKDALLGARMFYSPERITHLKQPLYHANVPNLNCRGYGTKNAVGWLCLYHTAVACPTVADKARYLIDRASGGEPYNDGNMSETDGPRFYNDMLKAAEITDRDFLFQPLEWEAKTEAEGVTWTLDRDLWIPVLVAGVDEQDRHVPDGVPLSLGMAMYGKAKFYYHDNFVPKVYDTVARGLDWTDRFEVSESSRYGNNSVAPGQDLWDSLSVEFANMTKRTRPALDVDAYPLETRWSGVAAKLTHLQTKHDLAHVIDGGGSEDYDYFCVSCGNGLWEDDVALFDDEVWCANCVSHCSCCEENVAPGNTKSLPTNLLIFLPDYVSASTFCESCFDDLVAEAREAEEEAENAKAEVKTKVKAKTMAKTVKTQGVS